MNLRPKTWLFNKIVEYQGNNLISNQIVDLKNEINFQVKNCINNQIVKVSSQRGEFPEE